MKFFFFNDKFLKCQKNYVTDLCVLHQIAKPNYLLWWGKSYFKSSNKISYLFYADIKIKKKKVSFLDENSVYTMLYGFKNYFYTNLKTKTNQLKYNNKRIQKTKNSVQNSKPQGVVSANNVVSPRVSDKRLNELILSDQGKVFQVAAKLGEINKYSTNKYIFKIEDEVRLPCS